MPKRLRIHILGLLALPVLHQQLSSHQRKHKRLPFLHRAAPPSFLGGRAPALCEYPEHELKYPYSDIDSFVNKPVEEILQTKLEQLTRKDNAATLHQESIDFTTYPASASILQQYRWWLWVQFSIFRCAAISSSGKARAAKRMK